MPDRIGSAGTLPHPRHHKLPRKSVLLAVRAGRARQLGKYGVETLLDSKICGLRSGFCTIDGQQIAHARGCTGRRISVHVLNSVPKIIEPR